LQPSFQGLRVLVVDDEEFVRDVTSRVLIGLGCPVPIMAQNGAEALQALQTHGAEIHLIISDLLMPDMDGVELVRHLEGRKDAPPILFMSGAQSALRRAAESLGRAYGLRVLGALPKPVTKSALADVLQSFASDQEVQTSKKAPLNIGMEDLERGLRDSEFCYHYQPKIRLNDHGLDSVEALARWQHPTHGLLPPGVFIGMAEASPLIGPMTEQLVEGGMRQLAQWRENRIEVSMAMNLSPSMLSDVSMPDRFAKAAAALALSPELITFEITETGVAQREAIYLEIITRLQMKGFRLSIDDFGTGQSSLQKLEALPFTELKIDRQFVHGIHKNEAKRAIFDASLSLAQRFNLKTVAEGAELQQDMDIVQESGCDVVQGFIISRPLSPEAFEAWVAKQKI
jgi:EAL domain-containing protein (putative c-di-GMP-specific phosphodiesterase class I)/CheY-like chemotaxis protein